MSLGTYIANKRKNRGLTQEELALKLHVSKSAVAKWETDGGIPDRDNLRRLAEVLGTSADELYRVIGGSRTEAIGTDLNITEDVIRALEAHGYKVIRPDK